MCYSELAIRRFVEKMEEEKLENPYVVMEFEKKLE